MKIRYRSTGNIEKSFEYKDDIGAKVPLAYESAARDMFYGMALIAESQLYRNPNTLAANAGLRLLLNGFDKIGDGNYSAKKSVYDRVVSEFPSDAVLPDLSPAQGG